MKIQSFLSNFERNQGLPENRNANGEAVAKVELTGEVTPYGKLLAAPSLPYVPGRTDCSERFKRLLVSKEGTELNEERIEAFNYFLADKYPDEDVYCGCSEVSGRVGIDQIDLGTLQLVEQSDLYVLFAGLQVQYRKQPHPTKQNEFVSIKSVIAKETYVANYVFEDIGGWCADKALAAKLKKELYCAAKEVERSTRELKEQTKAILLLGSGSIEGRGSLTILNDKPLPISVSAGSIVHATALLDISTSQEKFIGHVIGMPAISKRRVVVEKPEDYNYGGRDWFEKIVFWPDGQGLPEESDTLLTIVFRILQGAYPDDFSSNGCSAKSRNVKVNTLSLDLVIPIEQPYLGSEVVEPGGVIRGFFALIAEGTVYGANGEVLDESEWTASKIDHVVAKKIWISNQIIDQEMSWMTNDELRKRVIKQDARMSKLCTVLENEPDPPLHGWLGS